LKPYIADPILNTVVRYQANAAGTVNITRAQVLNLLTMNTGGSTTQYRLCQAVRVNKLELTVVAGGSIEWKSTYGPNRLIEVNGTSTTAAGTLVSRPPVNTLASFWSLTGQNESEILFSISTANTNDYLTVTFSFVLLDKSSPASVTFVNSGTLGQVYWTFLDGPRAGAIWTPIGVTSTD